MDAARIEADVRWLADDAREGRGAGTQGLEDTAAWLADAFRRAGLAPAGDDGGYLQRFEMPVSLRVVRETLRAGDQDFAARRDFATLLSSEDAKVRGRLVFAGYGISAPEHAYDDWEGTSVEDAVVLVLEDRPGGDASPFTGIRADAFLSRAHKVSNARDRGARALLLAASISDPEDAALAEVDPPSANPSQRSSGIPVLSLSRAAAERLVALAGGTPLGERQQRIDAALRPASELLPGVEVELEVKMERRMGSAANVVGILEGSDPRLAREAIVVGAHYDHLGRGEFGSLAPEQRGEIHNGADDNASGTAGVLELARAFAQGPRPRRSLVFAAFAGEEIGLFGSRAYVDAPALPLSDTVAMLNLDMVGRLRGGKLAVFGTGSSTGFPSLVRRALDGLSLDAAFSEDGFAPSDQTSFYARGVPVLMFFTGAHPQYHTPEDDASRIDAAGEARVLEAAYRVARELLDADSRPELLAAEAPAASHERGGYGPYLGTVPSFGEAELPGVLLQGVAPGSPAEKAGIRAGDTIVSFDDASIANLEEYAARLFAARPGQQVRIGLLRDGQRVEIVTTLGRRR
jgi:aminopeptidase YwaD